MCLLTSMVFLKQFRYYGWHSNEKGVNNGKMALAPDSLAPERLQKNKVLKYHVSWSVSLERVEWEKVLTL